MDKIKVDNIEISIVSEDQEGYISLTDMAQGKEDETRAADVIKNWIRSKNTIEFLGAWEQLYNPKFKVVDFDHFRNEAGSNAFVLSVKEWVQSTDAVGIFSKPGRNGGTYAHKDIAFEFGAWISPMFKLYLIKEYQRLKSIETDTYNLEWDVKRVLSKVNYHLHTDAVLNHIIPKSTFPKDKQWIEYAKEADLLNVALFGCTAKEWREANPKHAKDGKNIRDFASINELIVMSNIESLNAEMIKLNTTKQSRFKVIKDAVKDQLRQLKNLDMVKAVRKQSKTTYIEAQQMTGEQLEEITGKSILEKNQEALSKFNENLKKGIAWNPKDHQRKPTDDKK
jgi:hypothetical protein